ncbi:MAG: transcriptional repressor [Actinobacteria bacterium]|nr:transcriptional repressor [Actinomycetota bacterium]
MSGRSQKLKQGGAEHASAEHAEPGGASETRRTQQRQAIFHELAHGDRALSAQELHERLRAADAGVGLATVYRNLGRLAEEGAIDAIRRPSGETAYRACGAGHHHHLTCRRCGAVVELHDCTIADWSRRIAAEHGFDQVEHQAELSGICANCR